MIPHLSESSFNPAAPITYPDPSAPMTVPTGAYPVPSHVHYENPTDPYPTLHNSHFGESYSVQK